MPPRGTAGLWPVRILTDFGKDGYVLCLLAAMLLVVALVAPRLTGASQPRLLGFGTRLQFLFFAVLVPLMAGELIKWVGRARPAVRRRQGQRLQLRAVRRNRGLFQLSLGARHHRVCAGFRGRRGLAAGAGGDDRLCAR